MLRFSLLVLLMVWGHAFGQRWVIRRSDSAGRFVFLCGSNGVFTTYSYGVGSRDGLDAGGSQAFMTKWSVSKDGEVYWTDGENIYRWDFKRSVLVTGHLHRVLELFVRGDNIYAVYNPKKEEGIADNRYDPGIRLCRIHSGTGVKEDLKLPRGLNVTNLTVSPGEHWISFFDTKGKTYGQYRLVLYNIASGELRIIDSADHGTGGTFGDEDKKNSSCWTGSGSDSLIYYKHSDHGKLMLYRVAERSTTTWLERFPERDFSWFSVADGYLYCSDRLTVYRTKDGLKKQVEYRLPNYRSSIRNAEVVR